MIYLLANADQLPDTFPETCGAFLPRERKNQMMSYTRWIDRKLCAAGYVLLVYALKREDLFTELPILGYGPFNKPFLINYPGIHFNLSHCDHAVVCALYSSPVGIDIEKVAGYDEDLARYICNQSEYEWVTRIPELKSRRLMEMWTRKESGVKLRGTGIDREPRYMKSNGCQVLNVISENTSYIISLNPCSKKPIP